MKCLIFLLFTSSFSLYSQFAGGTGTAEDPFQVATAEHLNNVRNYLSSNFIQTADIDLGVPPWNEGEGWEPIGYDYTNSFKGVYDGNKHYIANLTIKKDSLDYIGLFGVTNGAQVENTKLNNVDVTGLKFVGSLVGRNINSNVEFCNSTGIVKCYYLYIGGLIGSNTDSSYVNECSSLCIIDGFADVGGLVGLNISNSYIERSFSNCFVSGEENVGGLVGHNYESTINNCFVSGTSNNYNDDIGGLVGFNYRSSINNCYSLSKITGIAENAGGLIGYSTMSTVTNSYWNTEVSGLTVSAGGEGRTTAEMTYNYSDNTYVGWDFDSVWTEDMLGSNNGYPFFQWQLPQTAPAKPTDFIAEPYPEGGYGVNLSWINPTLQINGDPLAEISEIRLYRNFELMYTISNPVIGQIEEFTDEPNVADYYDYKVVGTNSSGYGIIALQKHIMVGLFAGGEGTETAPYLIATPGQLNNVRKYPLSYYLQTNDINLSESSYSENWLPIGSESIPFSGNFNGNNFTVKNVVINYSSNDFMGFFGYVMNGTIKNLKLENIVVTGNSKTGALAGTIIRSNITACCALGTVTGNGDYTGGLAGYNFRSTVSECYADCEVTGKDYVGGLTGYNNNLANIASSYSMGNVTGTNYAGGFTGYNFYSTITNSYSTGYISCTGINKGGFAAYNEGNEITGCYWNTETSGITTSTGGEGRTSDEMTYPYAVNTFLSWDFTNIWQADNMNQNQGYPYLSKLGTGIEEDSDLTIPKEYVFYQNYPNPFNDETRIQFSLNQASEVEVKIFNVKGEFIKNIVSARMNRGLHSYSFKADDLNSGIYYYALVINGALRETRKMIYLR